MGYHILSRVECVHRALSHLIFDSGDEVISELLPGSLPLLDRCSRIGERLCFGKDTLTHRGGAGVHPLDDLPKASDRE